MKTPLLLRGLLGILILFNTALFALAQPKPVALLVNGKDNCCLHNGPKYQYTFQDAFAKMEYAPGKKGIEVHLRAWNSAYSQWEGSNSLLPVDGTVNFARELKQFARELPAGTPLILIGHSFGGDSIIRALPWLEGTGAQILFVGVLDPVGFGGQRALSVRYYEEQEKVSQHVRYFFNRWQNNTQWPIDTGSSGNISNCKARQCDQDSQNRAKKADGSLIMVPCSWYEFCREKPGRLAHVHRIGPLGIYDADYVGIVDDEYIQQTIINIVTTLVTGVQDQWISLDDMIRAVFGRPMTLDEYEGYSGHLSQGWTVQGLREHLAQHHHESLGKQAAIYQEVLGRAIDDGTLRGHAALLGSGYFQDLRHLRTHIACVLPEAKNTLVVVSREVRGEPPMDETEQQTYCNLLAQGWTQEQVREVLAHSARAYGHLEAIYQAVLGRAMDNGGWQTHSNLLASGWTLGRVREAIAHSPEAHDRLEAIYQVVLGRAMENGGWQTHPALLAQGWTLDQVRNAIAHSPEASNDLKALYLEVWGHPIDSAYLDYYTFLLSTDGTLADVRADMEALRLQTVVLPVLIAVSVLQ